MLRRLRNRQRGFTLIELLIVVAIIGIIAAILIPNLIDALQKAKQKRTVADERNIGTAFMSYITDVASAGAAGAAADWNAAVYVSALTSGELASILHPSATFFYLNSVPELDGWKNSFRFAWSGDPSQSSIIAIGSGARDGDLAGDVASLGTVTVGGFTPTDYNQNIIWADGFFIRYPSNVGASGG